jgi:hypothetical protein
MTQEKIEHIMTISYLKSITEVQARILITLESKSYKDLHKELSINVLNCNIGLLESYRDNNFKNNPTEQQDCDKYINDLKNQIQAL